MAELDPFPRLVVDRLIVELAEAKLGLSADAEHALLVRVWRNTRRGPTAGREQEAERNVVSLASSLQKTAQYRERFSGQPIELLTLESALKPYAGLCPGFWPFC